MKDVNATRLLKIKLAYFFYLISSISLPVIIPLFLVSKRTGWDLIEFFMNVFPLVLLLGMIGFVLSLLSREKGLLIISLLFALAIICLLLMFATYYPTLIKLFGILAVLNFFLYAIFTIYFFIQFIISRVSITESKQD